MQKLKPLSLFMLAVLIMPLHGTQATEITLRMHHMLSPQAIVPAKVLSPWAQKIETESAGRLKIEIYPSMRLGGVPADLIDQVTDGDIDLTWTLFGYTPERFPLTETFELPFMGTNATATSMAFQAYFNTFVRHDPSMKGLHVLAVHTHGRGLLHTRDKPIKTLKDLDGLKLRGTSRVVNGMLMALGARPLAMPITKSPEALSNGTIDGTVAPFEILTELEMHELAPFTTEISDFHGLYTATFVLAMNADKYRELPADLRKIIDDNSGMTLAMKFGQEMDYGDLVGRWESSAKGNTIVQLDAEETGHWRVVSEQLTQQWFEDMQQRGFDGKMLYDSARRFIEAYSLAY